MKSILFSALLFLSATCHGQKIWFQDDFNDYSKGWFDSNINTPEMKRRIAEGKFYMEQIGGGTNWSVIGFWTDPTKDFSLTSNMMQSQGNDGNGFGVVVFGANDKRYFFLIKPSRPSFYVGYEQRGTWTESKNWTASPFVNGQQVPNKLEVIRKGDRISFVLNDHEVFGANQNEGFQEMLSVSFYGIVTLVPMKIEVDDFIFRQNNTINVIPNAPAGLRRTNLGATVNSVYVEKTPLISHDGKTLYFTVGGDPANFNRGDDIYMSTGSNDTVWSQRTWMGTPLNNTWPNSVISVSPDNNTMILMNTYLPDGSPKGSGISTSNKTRDGWSVPTDVVIRNYYNKGSSNEFCLSADGKVLLMSLQRDDTYGSNDLYISFLKENGEYSEPRNLGPNVNTFLGEATPFMAADGVSLYFASQGHPGYGSTDIFVTKRLDSTWTSWSKPQNMGPGINSTAWDAYYTVPASGQYAYMVSQLNSIGLIDIFRIKLPTALKPKPVVLIYGKVLNSDTKEPIEARIVYNILSTNKESGIAVSNVKDGTYKIVLPASAAYSFLAMKDKFYSVSENIDLRGLKEYKEIERNLYLAPIAVGETIRLNNLFFDFSKSALRSESAAELERVIKLLTDNPNMVIEISGHTDNVGGDLSNNKLSFDRATAVKTYLVNKGFKATRIQVKGYGKTKPVGSNDTEAGRQENRRVEFRILKK